MQRDTANDLQSFFSLAYHGKSGQGRSPLPSDDSPVAFQQNESRVSVHARTAAGAGRPRPRDQDRGVLLGARAILAHK